MPRVGVGTASEYQELLGEGTGSALESGRAQLEARGDRGAVCWDQHSVYCQEPCRASEQSNLINFLRELEPNPIEIGLEQEPAGCLGLWAAAPGVADQEP